MANVALIPELNVRIPALQAVVDGYPESRLNLSTRIGGEPLESGARIVDHAVADPVGIRLTGWVSGMSGAAGASPASAMRQIEQLQESVTPLRVVTPHRTYDEMLIERFRTEQRGRGLRFTMDLREVDRVQLGGVQASPLTGGLREAGTRLATAGAEPAESVREGLSNFEGLEGLDASRDSGRAGLAGVDFGFGTQFEQSGFEDADFSQVGALFTRFGAAVHQYDTAVEAGRKAASSVFDSIIPDVNIPVFGPALDRAGMIIRGRVPTRSLPTSREIETRVTNRIVRGVGGLF